MLLSRDPNNEEYASTRELVLVLAERFYPGVERLEELPEKQRTRWVRLQLKITGLGLQQKEFVRFLAERDDEEVEAQVTDFLAGVEKQERELDEAAALEESQRVLRSRSTARRRWWKRPSRGAQPPPASVPRPDPATSVEADLIPPPPPSPTYDRLFGNQIRWAIHVIRYSLQQRRLKLADPKIK
jgi:hypothetical protein